MNDPAATATDEIISEIEKKIAKEYKKAHKEVAAKMDDYLARFAKKDEIWQKWVASGKKTEAEYKKWKTGQILVGARWADVKQNMADDYANTAKIAASIAKGYQAEVYAINHNYATYQVESGAKINTNYSLYSRESVERMYRDNPRLYHTPGKNISQQIKEGKLQKWDKRRIQSVLMQGIIQGESIPNLTKRLEAVTAGDHKAAIRNARTMMTGVQNGGRIDAIDRANSLGIETRKQWMATLDSRTRHWHRQLDGVVVDNDKPFEHSVPGVTGVAKIMFPGDPTAHPADLYNCRCTLIAAVKGHEMDLSDTSLRYDAKLGNMSYDEWKAEKTSTSDPITKQETIAAAMKQHYINEYAGGHGVSGTEHAYSPKEGSQNAAEYAQSIMDEMNQKTYSGIWKEDVTPADYAAKAASIPKKLAYYDEQIALCEANGWTAKYDKLVNLRNDLLEFEQAGKDYEQAKSIKSKFENTESKLPKKDNTQKKAEQAQKIATSLEQKQYDGIWGSTLTVEDYEFIKNEIQEQIDLYADYLKNNPNGWTAKEAKTKMDGLQAYVKDAEEYGKATAFLSKNPPKKEAPPSPTIDAKTEIDKAKAKVDAMGSETFPELGGYKVSDYSDKKVQNKIKKEITKLKYNLKHLDLDEEKLEETEAYLDVLQYFKKQGTAYEKALAELEKLQPKPAPFATESYTDERKSKGKRYRSRTEADEYHRPILDKKWDELTEFEKYAVWEYTHNSNPMNKPLSGYANGSWNRRDYVGPEKAAWSTEDNWRRFEGKTFAKKFGTDNHVNYHKTITSLTKAIDKNAMEDDVWLVRGSDTNGLAGLFEGNLFSFDQAKTLIENARGDTDTLRSLFQGQIFQGHSFLSTGIATDSGFSGDVSYSIYAPKGTKGIYAEPASYFGDTVGMNEKIYKKGQSYYHVGHEAEVILQRGTKYRVADIESRGGNINITLEVVEQPDYFEYGDEDTVNEGKTRHKN